MSRRHKIHGGIKLHGGIKYMEAKNNGGIRYGGIKVMEAYFHRV